MDTCDDTTLDAFAFAAAATSVPVFAVPHRRLRLPDRGASAELVTVDGDPIVRVAWADAVAFFPLTEAAHELVGAVDVNGCRVDDTLSFLGAVRR